MSPLQKQQLAKYQIPSIVRAFKVMDTLSQVPRGMTMSELSRTLKLPVSSTSAILSTLHSLGLLIKEETHYILGTRVLELGNRVLQEMELKDAVEGPLRRLVGRVNVTAHAGILEERWVVVIEKIEAHSFIRINTYVGRREYPHCTAMGKVLLACRRAEELEAILTGLPLPRFTPQTITDPDELRQMLARVREQGYAIDDEEEEIGIRAIAAPIFAQDGQVRCAISLTGTTSQLTLSRLEQQIEALRETARSISLKLGWSVPDPPA